MTRDSQLPVSQEAERAILGAILLNDSLWSQAAQLKPEDFSLDAHRRIYGRMCNLQKCGRPVDMILLVEELGSHKELDAIGGMAYLSSLIDGVPERPSIEHYVCILKNNAVLRETAKFGESLSQYVSQPGASPDAVRGRIAAFQAKLDSAMPKTSSRIQRWEQIPTLDRLPVGDVDWVVEGMIPAGSVVLWAGESGSYKTWLSLFLAKAVHEGDDFLGRKTVQRPVLYLDRENPSQLIQERCSLLGIQSSEAFRFWGGWQSDQPPMIGDRRLLELARTMKPLLVVDSFIRFHAADENSATEMGRVMGEVRALANAGAVVVLQHHKPKAEGTQYRGSSDIKAGVDIAFAITCEKQEKTVSFQCFKNRFGEETRITIKPKVDEGGAFEVTSDPMIVRQHDEERAVLGIVEAQPGIIQTQIVKQADLPVHKVLAILQRGEGTLWRTEKGPRGRLEYHPLTADSSFSAFQPYSTENLKSSSGEFNVIEGEI
jgi:hypothetical protein